MTSGSFASPNSVIGYFRNTGATNITNLSISYNAERYRVNTAAASIQFFYSLDGTNWTAVTAGDVATSSFPTGASAYQFNPPLTTVNVSAFNITSLSIAPSSDFYLRWNLNTTGSSSQGIAVDDISVTATFASLSTSVQFISTSSSAAENSGTANLALAITNFSVSNATSVTISASGATGRITSFTTPVVFPANDGSNQNCTVTLDNDALCNGSENVILTITGISGGDGTPSIGANNAHIITVNDDETTVDPVATAGTNISTSGFDANWSNIGATTYFLDVSRYSDFMEPATTDVVLWNFPAATNDNIADGGIAANAAKTLTAVGAANLTFNSAGNGGLTARADGWNGGDGTKYWQVELETTGYGDIKVSSKQRSSNTGPRDFKLQYRIGTGGAWVDVSGGAITVADNYTTGALNALSLPAACADQGQIFLRWVMTSNTSVNNGTVAAGGASNMDDVLVTGRAFSYVGGYDGFDAGSATSESLTGLLGATTYHYRVRATGGCASAVYSNTISVTTDAVDTYYSRATGNVNDPIWSDTPSGTAGPAV
ncbi:MAG TPA: fibronectin type III domain-containing protein [Flavobacteriales bacterium]|nr:fibronectin type III domain-containing protein [Flavobacteriales bacterium]